MSDSIPKYLGITTLADSHQPLYSLGLLSFQPLSHGCSLVAPNVLVYVLDTWGFVTDSGQ